MATMRVYCATTISQVRVIFRDGWTDLDTELGMDGVYVSPNKLDINDGAGGNVTLCVDIPEQLFDRFEVTPKVEREILGVQLAVVPAAELNKIGKPQVYNHEFAGLSRRDLVKDMEILKAEADVFESANERVSQIREAIEFFDEIGWLTPLKLEETAGEKG